MGQISLQNERFLELQEEYKEFDPNLSKIKIVKNKLEDLRKANEQLHFNIGRHKDMLPLIELYQERVINNNKMIQNYKESIEAKHKENPENIEEINEKLKNNYMIRKKLEEKTFQMKLYQDLYENSDQLKVNDKARLLDPDIDDKIIIYKDEDLIEEKFFKIIGTDPLMNQLYKEREFTFLRGYKRKKEDLTKEIEELTVRLNSINDKEKKQKESKILLDPSLKIKHGEILQKMETIESREKILTDEVI